MRAHAAGDHDRPSAHLKGRCLATVLPNGDDATPHPLAGKLPDVTVDEHHSAAQAVVTAGQGAADVVPCGTVNND
jgi:hypothetical protein